LLAERRNALAPLLVAETDLILTSMRNSPLMSIIALILVA
jgi:hypothetical protein